MTETDNNYNNNSNSGSVSNTRANNVSKYIFSNVPVQLNRTSVLKNNNLSFSCLIANVVSLMNCHINKCEYTSKPLPYLMNHVAVENINQRGHKRLDTELLKYMLSDIIGSSANGDIPKRVKLFLNNDNENEFELSYNDYWFHKPLNLQLRKNLAIKLCGMMGVDDLRIGGNRINTNDYPLEYFERKYSKRQRKIIALNFMNILDVSDFEVFKPKDK